MTGQGKKIALVLRVNWQLGPVQFCLQEKLGKEERVISLNMIAHDKGVVNHFLRSWIYNRGFSAERMIAAVNSEELRDLYLKSFKIRPDQLYVFHDCWAPTYEQRKPSVEGEAYVFSGGEAARDWDFLLKGAWKVSEVKFE